MIKKLLSCVREYKLPSILAPVFIVGEVLIECCIPLLTAGLIDEIEASCGIDVILKYGIGLVVLAGLSLICGVLSGHYCAIASCGFAKNLRHDLYHRVQDFSFTNIDKFSAPSLVTRLTTDVSNVQMAYMMLIRTAIRCPLMLIMSFVMSINLGGKLSLVFAVIIPFLGFGLFFIISKVRPIFKRVFKKYDKLNESVQENIRGMRVVKSFVREEYEMSKFDKASSDVRNDFTKAERLLALNDPLMLICIYSAMILISYFAAKTVITTGILNEVTGEVVSEIGIGAFTGMTTYSMQILISMMMVSMIFVMLSMSLESANRIVEVLDEKSNLTNPENPITEVKDGSIDFENVYYKYHKNAEKHALDNINLHIKSGETIGIIGTTGSSKSTLISLISRLYDVNEGAVKVGGVDVRDYDLNTLRDNVAVVLQKNVLFSGTIKENLRWGDPNATDEELEHICKLSMADEFIKDFPDKYDTYIEQGGTNVSGGQKQRLCIARALLKKPKVLILDDSTSAVDTKTDAMIRKAFREEIPGTTKLIVAQRIASVESADKIIVIDDGKISAFGPHDELLKTSEIYREVYESQTKGGDEE